MSCWTWGTPRAALQAAWYCWVTQVHTAIQVPLCQPLSLPSCCMAHLWKKVKADKSCSEVLLKGNILTANTVCPQRGRGLKLHSSDSIWGKNSTRRYREDLIALKVQQILFRCLNVSIQLSLTRIIESGKFYFFLDLIFCSCGVPHTN